MEIVYKQRQEEILMKELTDSKLVTQEILLDIKKFHDRNPYHNFVHALKVARWTLLLSLEDFNIIEIKSLLYAALFHDALHTWTARVLDEFYSLTLAQNKINQYQEKYNLQWIDYWILRKWIIWTVFKNRWILNNKYSRVLADLDVWVIGEDIFTFMYYSIPLALEFEDTSKKFFKTTNIWYFKFLIWMNKKVIISDEVRKIYPNALKVMKEFINMDIKLKDEMFYYVLNNDITLDEFKNEFKNKIDE